MEKFNVVYFKSGHIISNPLDLVVLKRSFHKGGLNLFMKESQRPSLESPGYTRSLRY